MRLNSRLRAAHLSWHLTPNPVVIAASALLLAGGLAAVPAHAATGDSSGSSASSMSAAHASMNSQDRMFVEMAGPSNMAEVKTGELAAEKGSTPAVQEFGRWMQSAHAGAYTGLAEITRYMGMQVSSTPTSMQQSEYSKLQGLSGTKFDQQYLQMQETAHLKSIKLFHQEAEQGHNRLLVLYATNLSPALQSHLAEIKDLMKTDMNTQK